MFDPSEICLNSIFSQKLNCQYNVYASSQSCLPVYERIRAGSPGATNAIIDDLISGSIGSNENNQGNIENFDNTFEINKFCVT